MTPLTVSYMFGLAEAPQGFGAVSDIVRVPGGVKLVDGGGREVFAACDVSFVTGERRLDPEKQGRAPAANGFRLRRRHGMGGRNLDPFQRRKLGSSSVMLPQMGFGGAPLGDLFTRITDAEAQATLTAAWDAGIRYYDTAPWYGRGQSEHRFGRHLYHRPRGEAILSTKVGRVLQRAGQSRDVRPRHLGRRPVLRYPLGLQLRRHHARLRGQPAAARHECDRHPDHPRSRLLAPPHRGAGVRLSVAAGDQRLPRARRAEGARPDPRHRRRHQRARHDPALPRPVRPRLLHAGAALHAGRAGRPWKRSCRSASPAAPASSSPACSRSGLYATGPIAGAKYNYADATPEQLDRARRIEAVCQRHDVPLAAAAIQFPLHHPAVASVIPGGFRPEHVTANLELMRREIPAALWAELKHEGLLPADAPTG